MGRERGRESRESSSRMLLSIVRVDCGEARFCEVGDEAKANRGRVQTASYALFIPPLDLSRLARCSFLQLWRSRAQVTPTRVLLVLLRNHISLLSQARFSHDDGS